MIMIRKILLALIIVVGLTAIGAFLVGRHRYSRLELKSCFTDVHGLKVGASVRIAGVDVGTVRRVTANPQLKNCPAEVDMELATPYEITVPRDAIAGIATAGLLGETYVDIDTVSIENNRASKACFSLASSVLPRDLPSEPRYTL